MAWWGLLIILLGIIFAYFSFGGKAKIEIKDLNVVITAGAGVILIIFGFWVFFILP